MSKGIESLKKSIVERYISMTGKSREYTEKAKKYLPGGDTRSVAYFKPYPFCSHKGERCWLTDIDGNCYLDMVNNFTSLVHGHAHPKVVEAIEEQARLGTAHGTPVENQYNLSKLLCERIPDIGTVRYCNSASEATMYAMRAARLFTKKDAFIRIDGGYNGCHDYVEINITPDYRAQGMPTAKTEPGIPQSTLTDTYIIPFNDLEAAESMFKKHSGRIAGVIMEPMLGAAGLIMPEDGYLAGMRKLADQYNVLLVFDETITLRYHTGGLHTMQNVQGDIIATGKIVGGGLPVGAFGARREIMDIFNPERADSVSHSGTFSGNALTMAAGYASMKLLTQSEIDRINALGDRLHDGFDAAFKETGVAGRANGFGSIVGITFSKDILKNAKDVILSLANRKEILTYLQLCMLAKRVYYVARGMFVVSTAMTEKEIDQAVAAFKESLIEVLPIIEDLNKKQ